jgi:hypothetical protein
MKLKSSLAVAFFLPGWAKDLPAPLYSSLTYSTEGVWWQQSGVSWFQHVCKRWNQFEHIQNVGLSSKVKESRNTPDVARRVPGGLGSWILWHSAREGGEVVSLTQGWVVHACKFVSMVIWVQSIVGGHIIICCTAWSDTIAVWYKVWTV